MSKIEDLELKLAKFPAKERERLGEEGKALPQEDGPPSFPIRNEQDLKNAIQAFGRAKDEDKPRLKRFIKKRARELDLEDLIPDDWEDEDDEVEAASNSSVEDMVLLSYLDDEDTNLIALGSGASLDRSPKKNWVENTGQLPRYVREIARSIERKRGVPLSRAISLAIGAIKRWASGRGDVNADTRAKAVKALAEWTALKAKNKARKLKNAAK